MAIQKPKTVSETPGVLRLRVAIKDGAEALEQVAPIITASNQKIALNQLAVLEDALRRARQAEPRLGHLAAYSDDPHRATAPHTDHWLDAQSASLRQATADVIHSARVIGGVSMRAAKQTEVTA